MEKLQIVGVGLSTLDILFRLEKMPDWSNPGFMDEIKFDGGGPTGTGIVAASRLGALTGFVGTAGNDWVGEIKLRSLQDNEVDTSRVIIRDHPETQIVICYVDSNSGERVFTGAKTISSAPLKVEELDKEYITSAEYMLTEGFHFEASLQAAKWMREAGKKVVLDAAAANTDSVSPVYKKLIAETNILICGSGFVQALTGKKDILEAAKAALDFGPEIVVSTEGEEGSYLVSKTQHFHTPAFKVDAVDTTGAGDVFHGAFIVGLLKGWRLEEITRFASAVSAIECTRFGGRAGIPYYQEVETFLKEHHSEIKGE